eukprot:5006031-Prymnesium_polylepis.1
MKYVAPPAPPFIVQGSANCAANHGNCLDSHCCQSPKMYSCYSKGDFYAACLPTGTCEQLWPTGSCEVLKVRRANTLLHSCSFTSTHINACAVNSRAQLPAPPPPPHPPPPPPHKSSFHPFVAMGSDYCAPDFEECSTFGCCRSPKKMSCYRKGPHYAACIPIGSCQTRWPDGT